MRPQLTHLVVLTALAASSCAAPDYEQRPFARLNVIAWDDTDVQLEAMGYKLSGETDHKSFELAGGFSSWNEEGEKVNAAEFALGISEFYDLDAIEFSGGGRFFFANLDYLRPYASIHSVGIFFDDDLGTQLGLRAGVGSEVPVGENFFFDLNLNYLLPLLAAEDEVFNAIETEVDGISLRLGIGYDF